MKIIALSFLLLTSVFADTNVTAYRIASGGSGTISRGCREIVFDVNGGPGYTFTIQGNSFTGNGSKFIVLTSSNSKGKRMGSVTYSTNPGTGMNITEVR